MHRGTRTDVTWVRRKTIKDPRKTAVADRVALIAKTTVSRAAGFAKSIHGERTSGYSGPYSIRENG